MVPSWWAARSRGWSTPTTRSESRPSSRMWRPGDPLPSRSSGVYGMPPASGVRSRRSPPTAWTTPPSGRSSLPRATFGNARRSSDSSLQVALHDLLTDLPNRTLFHDRVGQALASAARGQRHTTVLSVDLDGFKLVNESLGHAVGDLVLQEVSRRLRASVRAADTCARLGGDEFGVLLDGHSTPEDALAAADRILAALREPIDLADNPIDLTASMGVCDDRADRGRCGRPAAKGGSGEVSRPEQRRRSSRRLRTGDAGSGSDPVRARSGAASSHRPG